MSSSVKLKIKSPGLTYKNYKLDTESYMPWVEITNPETGQTVLSYDVTTAKTFIDLLTSKNQKKKRQELKNKLKTTKKKQVELDKRLHKLKKEFDKIEKRLSNLSDQRACLEEVLDNSWS